MYEKALTFARNKHENQVRKFNGEPYVNHPIRVANIVKEFTSNEDMLAAALLHDTIEDTNATIEDIKLEFNDNIANMVWGLTSDKDQIKKIGKTNYLSEKLNKMSSDELLIKLADRLDNVSDLSSEQQKWSTEYSLQTNNIILSLNNPNCNKDHLILIDRIKEKISPFIGDQ